jgi:hypothetical protein
MEPESEPQIAFAAESAEPPGLEIRVNFGVFAGREATAAEIDELARALLPGIGEVSIVSEQRHELSEDVEASLHQVRIEVDESQLPSDPVEFGALRERLLHAAEQWAQACIADRHTEVAEL